MARSEGARPTITSARRSRSEDVEMRQRRYVITMLLRTACFLLMFVVPGIWKIVAVAGAAVLPAIAVVLANARENRTNPADLAPHDEEPVELPQLGAAPVIRGEVVDDGHHPAA